STLAAAEPAAALANINTPGFKRERPLFEDASPFPGSPRVLSRLMESMTDMTQGVVQKTERNLDVALRGNGFFAVETPVGVRYTRAGNFTINAERVLVTAAGHPVLGEGGPVRIIGPDVAIDGDGNIKTGGAVAGRLRVVDFADSAALVRQGNYFAPLPAFLPAQARPEGTLIEQGVLEVSNMNAVTAMTSMIEAMRSYETQTKMIETIDDMTRKSIEEVGRF
ncbi:MAG: flagellar hook-basal body complex protein, partial [Deltaproteobacteria bacterium]